MKNLIDTALILNLTCAMGFLYGIFHNCWDRCKSEMFFCIVLCLIFLCNTLILFKVL